MLAYIRSFGRTFALFGGSERCQRLAAVLTDGQPRDAVIDERVRHFNDAPGRQRVVLAAGRRPAGARRRGRRAVQRRCRADHSPRRVVAAAAAAERPR